MSKTGMGICLLTALLAGTSTPSFAAAASAQSLSDIHNFNIPPQDMGQALVALSKQSGISLFFRYEEVNSYRTSGVRGTLPTDDALRRILSGTNLEIIRTGKDSVAIAAPKSRGKRSQGGTKAYPALAEGDDTADMGAGRPPAERNSEPIIVTGTRSTNRTATDSLAPVDVISKADLQTSGKQSTRDLLGTLVPSINVSNDGAGASFAVKTLSLRGLSGDQLLVLVNGKRRHNTATIFINGGTQNGQSPPDLDLIPSNAISRIEVLRDGAAAQYGSDAIAGVINIILKDDTSGNAMMLGGVTGAGDGVQGRYQLDKGFAFGNSGFLHLSAEGYMQGRTSRSGINTLVNEDVNMGGQPQVWGGNFAYDAGTSLGDSFEFYSFGTISKRTADAYLTYRTPGAVNNIPELFPNGYSPHLYVKDFDFQVAGGIRGDLSDTLHVDLSTTYSRDKVDYSETTTLNASLGPDSPTTLYIGSLTSTEWTSNLDVTKSLEVGLAAPMTISVGAEYRDNGFRIGAGEPDSYINGGYVSTTGLNAGAFRAVGSQGVTGFPDTSAGTWHRHNWSAYINIEQTIIDGLDFGLAGRHEDYSDFGTTNTGKASLRIEPVHGFAIRGTASTGFRAPTLQQEHYSSASTINVNGQLLPVSALPVDTEAAIALGAEPLKPEKSTNFSAGIVFTAIPKLTLTVDAYQVKIRDRILLSQTLTGSTVLQVLNDAGIYSSAGGFYFSNAADTRTRGLDIVGTYKTPIGSLGDFSFTLSANFNKTTFTHIDQLPDVLADAGLVLIGGTREGDFTRGTPHDKFIANINWSSGPASLNLRATRYGEVTWVLGSPTTNQTNGAKVLIDLEGSYEIRDGIKISAGANNLLNTYPDKLPAAFAASGFLKYNFYSPYGVSGGFYYGKLTFSF
ncbi:TonB-dependent receptor [Novosphingobium album (ex Hu et al. 2023)]|uniref:TonB-dependent receptor n=1 Tax=Novosphingobium album (ex Hu et al. 2023) TaxID=2930093 RepID=A0ABT0B082_9SPHN|nr:TonB-dependent receptor [Novosphingobium album (ex Hu et al. 2023)]MCJ2178459.1 TonB-dependent receptor [Novosphingobium album (ex Hu et al. 2023)]